MAYKTDLPTYLSRHFPALSFTRSVFYSCPFGLRFALGGRGPEPDVMELVSFRAKALYERAFVSSQTCAIVGVHWDVSCEDTYGFVIPPTLFELARLNDVGLRSDFHEFRESIAGGKFDQPDGTLVWQWVEQDPMSVDYDTLLRCVANADHGLTPSICSHLYFLDTQRHLLFHVYDDRGLDIVAESARELIDLYRTHNDWILDYDRERIDRIFQPLARGE